MNKKLLYYINLSILIINTVLIKTDLDPKGTLFFSPNWFPIFCFIPPIIGFGVSLHLRKMKCLSSTELIVQNIVVIISFIPAILVVISSVLFTIIFPTH